jgi:zinc transport system substrate-binding protein
MLREHRVGLLSIAGAGLILVLAATSAACGRGDSSSPDGSVRVVASFYPLAEAAEVVGGDAVVVDNLTPPGVEPHDLELAPDDLELLVTADVVLYLGDGFQPAVEDGVAQASGVVLDALDVVGALRPAPEEEGSELTADPHVWLDPKRYSKIVGAVADALSGVDPEDAPAFRANAEAYRAELDALSSEFGTGLQTCDSRTIVTNHAAFGYLADAYGLEQIAISGLTPEAEVDPARLAELRTLVQEKGITTIFTEELAPPEMAQTLADEAGVSTAVLNPLEGLTPDEVAAGEDYVSVMRDNLGTLREALGCA